MRLRVNLFAIILTGLCSMSDINFYNHASQLFTAIVDERPSPELDTEFPFYPLNALGMPLPGQDFVDQAAALGDNACRIVGKGPDKRLAEFGKYLHYLYRRALYDEQFGLNVNYKGRMIPAKFVPGHLLGASTKFFGGDRKSVV